MYECVYVYVIFELSTNRCYRYWGTPIIQRRVLHYLITLKIPIGIQIEPTAGSDIKKTLGQIIKLPANRF